LRGGISDVEPHLQPLQLFTEKYAANLHEISCSVVRSSQNSTSPCIKPISMTDIGSVHSGSKSGVQYV